MHLTGPGECFMQRSNNRLQDGGSAVMGNDGLPLAMTDVQCSERCRVDERCKVCFVDHFIICQR